MELKEFQGKASDQISERLAQYLQDPLMTSLNSPIIPFYQNLSSITGSGKTLILADTIEKIRMYLSNEPIVLWLSMGKVVVSQTLNNLSSGYYEEFVPSFNTMPLLECREKEILDDSKGLILMATVGKINQRDQTDGDRIVYKTGLDDADSSLWEMIRKRMNYKDKKRDLIIIYDEGHNLSDQQTKILLELNPTAFITASATPKVPKELNYYIQRLKTDKGFSDEDLVTAVSNKEVVSSELIKKYIDMSAYLSDMEITLEELIKEYKELGEIIKENKIDVDHKAMYVCDTNMLLSRSEIDEPTVPFFERRARPIQIWKQLVKLGISPDDIAVYCNLKMNKNFPAPDNFHLFNGGDNDYNEFIKGKFKHIIFNKSLQEGWDDPEVFFAYIDKDMGSKTQVSQVVGRVLRQPKANHFIEDERLNTARLYVKTDENQVVSEIVEELNRTLLKDIPEIKLLVRSVNSKNNSRPFVVPKREETLPDIVILTVEAQEEIDTIFDQMIDYRTDTVNVVGKSKTVMHTGKIGLEEFGKGKEEILEHSNKITARWLLRKELEKFAKKAISLCDMSNKKLDAMIEYSSTAAVYFRDIASKIANVYYQNSVIAQNSIDYDLVGTVFINPDQAVEFKNSLHEKYSGFNKLEIDFARKLDEFGVLWMRNPDNGFFKIPLLDGKGTNNFNPDFIAWKEDQIIVMDTKGSHLINEDSKRKLFNIEKVGKGKDLKIYLITQQHYDDSGKILNNSGYTLWENRQGKVKTKYFTELVKLLEYCLK